MLKVKQNTTKGECIPCNTSRCLSFQQVIATTTFESTHTKEKFNMYYKVSCKSNCVIYLLECLLCKIQYVRKSETPFHIRLNNHRKDIKNPNAIEACQHFNNWNHTKQRLKDRENYLIRRLKTLTLFGLNQELN